jgi:methanethiol S-methyltransferase
VNAPLKLAAATAAFAAFHSLMASTEAKEVAARVLGRRRRDATYRMLYNAQAIVTFAMLVGYGSVLPKRTLYRARGPMVGLLRIAQIAGVGWALLAAREVGVLRLAGMSNFISFLRREPNPPGPAAQGPERLPDGRLSTGGPFRWSRHPFNLAPVPVFWCTPHLTTRRLAFNVVATVYLVLGSLHEERRLRSLYGSDYEAYRNCGIPFFLPFRPW